MNIQEIRKALIGKTIQWNHGFNGESDYFVIGHVENYIGSVKVQEVKDRGCGVHIPKEAIPVLLSEGYYTEHGCVEGCPYAQKWVLSK